MIPGVLLRAQDMLDGCLAIVRRRALVRGLRNCGCDQEHCCKKQTKNFSHKFSPNH